MAIGPVQGIVAAVAVKPISQIAAVQQVIPITAKEKIDTSESQ